ncbi:tetratricopeptide repeat protein [Thermodesulfovibrionales bacterium]|nr:tetratricopeptide repeat protein [Thermodesulfovibrionales bacterium]MCL0035543.1 tetratricopeptide repeat protein [Thermodesulfovibrionales bacterium]MCL0036862.1 tetratricopeptide repeat protein [Thermodesulfovibrionales bacterium]MCL0040847.1 tetratricopeptide repeat protein [Thermodesulfovibrionales bacterium]MCL0042125.1 tetratricopeptide repeat protein [Thermodesulfovibrionales bacterium]
MKKQTQSSYSLFVTFLVLTACCLLFTSGCATTTVALDQKRQADFHYKMGRAYLSEGSTQMAYVHLQKALRLSPDNKEILNSLGVVYLRLEEFKRAKDLFLKAVSIDPEFSEAYANMGVAYMKTEQWQNAIESFEKALYNPLYRTPEKAFHNIGMAHYRVGQFELAIDALRDSIRRSPLFPFPHYGLALVYNKTGRYKDAALALKRAVELDPVFRGNKAKFTEHVRQRLRVEREETDNRDFMEIIMRSW